MNYQKPTSKTLGTILHEKNSGIIVVNDKYQRKIVWIEKSIKRDLIRSIFLDMPIGTIIIWSTFKDGLPQEQIIDGQQRISAIESFIKNEFELDNETLLSIVKNKVIGNTIRVAANSDSKASKLLESKFKKAYFKDLPDFLQKRILDYTLNITLVYSEDEEYIRDYFRVLQNQEKLKAGEILHSIPNVFIHNYLDSDDITKFCEIINFNDIRRGFVKHFTVFTGIVLDKTRIGQPDKEIIKLTSKIKLEDLENNEEFNNVIQKIRLDLNNSTLENIDKNNDGLLNVLGFKILLLSYLFNNNDDFLNLSLANKAKLIKKIATVAGYWNSKDASQKKQKLATKLEGIKSHDKDAIIEAVRESWLLSKTTHNKTEIKNKFEKINYLIDFLTQNPSFDLKIS